MSRRITISSLDHTVWTLQDDLVVFDTAESFFNSVDPDDFTLIVLSLPFAGFGYAIKEEEDTGWIEAAMRAFSLERLHYIKQLGSLHDPIEGWTRGIITTPPFEHSRFTHSLDVLAVASIICFNNWRALNHDQIKVIQLAALTHDVLSPAGGDAVKHIDPEALDEDINYPRILESEHVAGFLALHRIDKQLLIDTIAGKGVTGSVLDIADKIAYVARDAFHLVGLDLLKDLSDCSKEIIPPELFAISKLLKVSPTPASVWEYVLINDNGIYIENPEMLARFLKLRALLFRGLYCSQYARAENELVTEVLAGHFYERGSLSVEDLLRMYDCELIAFFEDQTGLTGLASNYGFCKAVSHLESCESVDKARERTRELLKQGIPFVRFENVQGFVKTGMNIPGLSSNGSVGSLESILPLEARKIKAIAKLPDPIRVQWIENDPLPKRLREQIIKTQLARLERQ